MAVIELLCRYNKESGDEIAKSIELELDTQAIIQGDKFNREVEKEKLIKSSNAFDYGPMMFNLKDVSGANHVDKRHTHITFYTMPGRTFKINYEQFKALYQTLLLVIINDFTNIDDLKT